MECLRGRNRLIGSAFCFSMRIELENRVLDFKKRRARRILAIFFLLLACIVAASLWRLVHGEMEIPVSRVFALLGGSHSGTPEAVVVRNVRTPRLFSALGVGAVLAVSGVVFQGMLQNPLAEPYTLGVASGAAFGAALAFSTSAAAVVPAAFAGALVSLYAVYTLAKYAGGGRVHIVLAGIIISSFLSAGVTFLKAVSGERLNAIVMWLMGGFSGASLLSSATVCFFALLSLCVSWAYGRQLDAISLGEHSGAALGVDERKVRILLLGVVSLASASAVSFFGIIGFVGLVVPHLLRMLIGSRHRPLLACSFLSGALLMVCADGLAQMLAELPVGVVTALLGVPCFCWIMIRRKLIAP